MSSLFVKGSSAINLKSRIIQLRHLGRRQHPIIFPEIIKYSAAHLTTDIVAADSGIASGRSGRSPYASASHGNSVDVEVSIARGIRGSRDKVPLSDGNRLCT